MLSIEQTCLDFLTQNLVPAEFPDSDSSENTQGTPATTEEHLDPLPCTDFRTLADEFDRSTYFTKSMEQCLVFGLAGNISVNLGGELIWGYLRGPPSGGKSMICDAISAAHKYAEPVGKMTGMHSGYKIGKSKKDHSTLKMVNGKQMIVKDWTTVISMPDAMLRNIYGELRSIYDGNDTIAYRNELKRKYKDIRFSILAAVTDEILRQNWSHLGERFVSIDITDPTFGSHKHVKTGLQHIITGIQASYPNGQTEKVTPPDKLLKIKRLTIGLLDHLHNRIRTCSAVVVPDDIINRLTKSARFIERIRGRVSRESGSREIQYRPKVAIGIRLAAQLAKIAMCTATVLGKTEVDEEVFRIPAKVAVDTAFGPNFDIVKHLMDCHDEGKNLGLSNKQLRSKISYLCENSITKRLEDMQHLKLVRRVEVPNNHGVRGRYQHLWEVIPATRPLWKGLMGD